MCIRDRYRVADDDDSKFGRKVTHIFVTEALKTVRNYCNSWSPLTSSVNQFDNVLRVSR